MTRIGYSLVLLLLSCACQRTGPDENLVLIQIQDRNGLSETISNPDRLGTYDKVDFLSSQPYQKVLRVYRKEGKNHSVITTYHPNGIMWQMLEAKEMRACGDFCEYFPNGQKKIEATVIGGAADLTPGAQQSWLFDGTSSVYNEDGALIASILYDKGVLSGPSAYYYPSGAIEKEVPYVQNQIDGDWKEFWESGQIKTRASYRHHLRDGDSFSWWPDGRLSSEETYDHGLLTTGRYFSLNGNLISEINHGQGFKAVFDAERLKEMQEVQNGMLEGRIRSFDSSGNLHCSWNVKNSQKQGLEIEYYTGSSSVPKISIEWDHDAIHGIVKTWYPNGQLQSQREMCRNKQNGRSCSWYIDGSLMLTEEYENEELRNGQYFRKNQLEPVSSVINGSGTATIYDEEGVFLRKVVYSKGKINDLE